MWQVENFPKAVRYILQPNANLVQAREVRILFCLNISIHLTYYNNTVNLEGISASSCFLSALRAVPIPFECCNVHRG